MQGNILLGLTVGWPFAAALLCYLTGRFSKRMRNYAADFSILLELLLFASLAVQVWQGETVTFEAAGICSLGICFVLDGFRALFGLLSAFLWLMSALMSNEYMKHERNRNRYYMFLLFTLGATMGVFLSADLYTTFIFFEIMSFTSYVWVAQNETPQALDAASTYLGIAVVGGLILLMGLFMLHHLLGTLRIDELYEAGKKAWTEDSGQIYTAGALILLGFGAKAGMFPLHVWMPKAHTVSPAPASVLLSGILTKAGLFGILSVSCNIFRYDPWWGTAVLLLGMVTMTLGAVLAVFAVNLKRTLACSSMSQIGFVLIGLGMAGLLGEENQLAVRGIVLHMMNHSLFKLVLFLAAGVVFMNLEELELNQIRGFGRRKPFLQLAFLSGALGIGGIPLFSGYVSKTLLHESIVEYIHEGGTVLGSTGFTSFVELLFLFCGGLTVAYMIKLYHALFRNRHPVRQKEFEEQYRNYANPMTKLTLLLSGAVIPVLGILPGVTMERIADSTGTFFAIHPLEHEIAYFSFVNLKGAVISVAVGCLVYFLFIKKTVMVREAPGCYGYKNLWPVWLDLEKKVYVPALTKWLPSVCAGIFRIPDRLVDFIILTLKETLYRPLRLQTESEEAARISRAERIRGRMESHKWMTISLSFGFLMCCIGIVIMVLCVL
ncbi:complex I subunit 5 family protein [Lactonifactor longoviformis]|uniref:complex I subunit 5 family protein n=1 Tax=Lactonifactor longoviformis TaxID=341220 RepID=UPI0036F1DF4C